jgi:hypothetical protein
MNCPHCDKDLTLNPPVLYNAEAYGKSCIAVALCCGHGVKVIPKMTFSIVKYTSNEKVDDWGHPLKTP